MSKHKACLRFFLTLTRETCWDRRQKRSYDPPDPPGYFDKVAWPHYLKNLAEIREKAAITYLDGGDSVGTNLVQVLTKVMSLAVPSKGE